jgi:hypothetical protein
MIIGEDNVEGFAYCRENGYGRIGNLSDEFLS